MELVVLLLLLLLLVMVAPRARVAAAPPPRGEDDEADAVVNPKLLGWTDNHSNSVHKVVTNAIRRVDNAKRSFIVFVFDFSSFLVVVIVLVSRRLLI